MKRLLSLLFLLFSISSQVVLGQLYSFKNYNYKEGLAFSNIKDIVQTNDGNIWLASEEGGLIRFNGKSFQEIQENNYNLTNTVSISKAKDNSIFFASKNKGIFQLIEGKINLIYQNKRQSSKFSGVYALNDAMVFVFNKTILVYRDNKIISQKRLSSKFEEITPYEFIASKNGGILLSNLGGFYISQRTNEISFLSNFINDKENKVYKTGYFNKDKFTLFDEGLSYYSDIIVNAEGNFEAINNYQINSPLWNNDAASTSTYISSNEKYFIVSKNGILYNFNGEGFTEIKSNTNEKPVACNKVIADIYGDLWLSSEKRGLYKVSIEPFTKVDMNPLYSSSLTSLFYTNSFGNTIISTESGQTHISNNNTKDEFIPHNFHTLSIVEFNGLTYLGTSSGLKSYNPKNGIIKDIKVPEVKDKQVSFLFASKKSIWIGIKDEGVIRYNPSSNEKSWFQNLYSNFPNNFLTAQLSFDGKYIVFGSKNGLHKFDINSKTFKSINDIPEKLGKHSFLSTIDKFGTRWFLLEKGILGITKANRKRVIQDVSNFSSFDFRIFSSDKLGNLIIGTNKGISLLKVNQLGNVKNVVFYNHKTGFEGYDIRKKVQFTNNNLITVGTIEGLYQINTYLLKHPQIPSTPFVYLKKDKNLNNKLKSQEWHFGVNNSKFLFTSYSYRLKGHEGKWSSLTRDSIIFYPELPEGKYTFEVKATNDGVKFSSINKKSIEITKPFWSSNSFIIVIVLVFLLLNIYLFNRSKSFDPKTIFSNKDNTISIKLIPRIIVVIGLINLVGHHVYPFFQKNIPYNYWLNVLSSSLITILYFITVQNVKRNKKEASKVLLIISISIILGENFGHLFLTQLNPYFLILIGITTSIIPLVFKKIRSTVFYSVGILLVSFFCFIFLNEVVFSKYIFLLIIISIIITAIFNTYLRHDSISKLLFISGVINKGDVISLAIDGDRKISYISENIENFIDIGHQNLINKKLSIFSNYIPSDFKESIFNNKDFKDGDKYLSPIVSINEKVIWIEWSCKVFSNDVTVLLGQDVTDKMELETTFEALVQNAEDFIYQIDLKGNFIFLNQQAISKLGYEKNNLLNTNSLSIVETDYHNYVSSNYRNHYKLEKDSSYIEFPIRKKDGTIIWIGQHVTNLYETGRTKRKGFLAVARDITEKREQEQIIREQQEDITSSIQYAKRIQVNLLPNISKIEQSFKNCFIIYKPRDIVSGDFYWMERIGDITVFSLSDCTGHGVPGSFMSLLGINLLNSIVLENKLLEPAKILDELDKKLIHVLPRGTGENKVNDGMEITICAYNHKTKELSYALAGGKFVVLQNGELNVLKGDSKHIGDYREEVIFKYKEDKITLNEEDTIYLLSDGFQDQFGGPRNKKFNFKKMRLILEENQNKSLLEQKETLERTFVDWIAEYEQTDDVSIIALKGFQE